MTMRTIVVTINRDWQDLKKLVKYASGDMLVFNNHISSNGLLSEGDKPKATDTGVVLSGYGQGRSAFNLPANTGEVWIKSEDQPIQIVVQTQ